jgi:dihydrofolate synthase / folylpolyglutamate synthase
MTFQETLSYLFGLGHETLAIKLGLRNTEQLLERLGNPQRAFESVQIAGTNGKGSTAAILDSICRTARVRTGLFISPHLVSVTERIRVDGTDISEEDFAKYASEVRVAAEDLVSRGKLATLPTFFEHITAIALLAFRDAGVSLAILETGLGGRLDATTVAEAATVAITPLALDHQEYLGETLEEIAFEKASIIRRGVAAVIAPQPDRALDVVLQRCADCDVEPVVIDQNAGRVEDVTGAACLIVTFETGEVRYEKVRLGLRGRHQIVNAAVAISLAESLRRRGFEISKNAIIQGVEKARHEGRLELLQDHPSFLFDGAHNPSGALALREFLDEFVKVPLTLVFGAMKDKKLEEIGGILFPVANDLILTQPHNPRAAGIAELEGVAARIIDTKKIHMALTPNEALQKAKDLTPPDGIICVTGSLYLVGEFKALINEGVLSQVAH